MSEWTKRRKAQIHQRLFGICLAVFTAGFWFWLLSYGTEFIWYAPIALLIIFSGLWLAVTDKIYFTDEEDEDDRA